MKTPQKKKTNDDQPRIDSLLGELNQFLNKPYPDYILLGEWLQNETLSMPSYELMEFLAVELLYGFERSERFIIADEKGVFPAMQHFVRSLKSVSDDQRRTLVSLAVARMKLWSLLVPAKFMHWWPCVSNLSHRSGKPGSALHSGSRRMTCHIIQLMTMQSIFLNDAPGMENLAEVVRSLREGKEFHYPESHRIAFQMFRWNRYLCDKLERLPTKTEMQMFLQTIYPDISESPATWNVAHHLLALQTLPSRSKKVDAHQIEKLALGARRQEELESKGKGSNPKIRKASKFRNMFSPTQRKTFKSKSSS
jgi:hypothetical protein